MVQLVHLITLVLQELNKHVKTFFGKSVSDISLAEASILAGMFQNPGLYNPYTKPNNTRKRQKIVLTLMVNHGYITEEEKKMLF